MEGYYNKSMTVDDISKKITSSYPFNETIVVEGVFYKKIKNGGSWKQGFLCGDGKLCNLNLSNGCSLELSDKHHVLCEGYLKAEVNRVWDDLGQITIKQHFVIKHYIDNEELIKCLKGKQSLKRSAIWEPVRRSMTKPKIGLVVPRSTTSMRDLGEGLRDSSSEFEFNLVELPYIGTSIEDYCKIIEKIDDHLYDVICFMSGGRDSKEDKKTDDYGVLHDTKVIRTIANMGTPTIGAIGHANEYHLFDMAFNETIATPSLLGERLHSLLLSDYGTP